MKFLKILAFLSALQSLLPFLKPQDRSLKTLLWLPKLIAGAFALPAALIGALAALIGLIRKDWKLAGLGLVSAGLAGKFINEVPASQTAFDETFGVNWEGKIPEWLAPRLMPERLVIPLPPATDFRLQQNRVFGQHPQSGVDLLADLWQPAQGMPHSGLGIVYLHGSGWRVGDKDMGTRNFFQRLASQGHVILDIAYTLWPEADIPTMLIETNQAVRWLKIHAAELGFDPHKVVLMGGSAGAHLALNAAYTAGNPAFQPAGDTGDTSVCGVVAFYPP
ncbi:MAG TPA: hypothetical protein DEH25_07725, partial [Chloroflexi bacterium]|nr:hypothetical protein [Chloroflexota bacterium]